MVTLQKDASIRS